MPEFFMPQLLIKALWSKYTLIWSTRLILEIVYQAIQNHITAQAGWRRKYILNLFMEILLREAAKKFFFCGPTTKAFIPPPTRLSGH